MSIWSRRFGKEFSGHRTMSSLKKASGHIEKMESVERVISLRGSEPGELAVLVPGLDTLGLTGPQPLLDPERGILRTFYDRHPNVVIYTLIALGLLCFRFKRSWRRIIPRPVTRWYRSWYPTEAELERRRAIECLRQHLLQQAPQMPMQEEALENTQRTRWQRRKPRVTPVFRH